MTTEKKRHDYKEILGQCFRFQRTLVFIPLEYALNG